MTVWMAGDRARDGLIVAHVMNWGSRALWQDGRRAPGWRSECSAGPDTDNAEQVEVTSAGQRLPGGYRWCLRCRRRVAVVAGPVLLLDATAHLVLEHALQHAGDYTAGQSRRRFTRWACPCVSVTYVRSGAGVTYWGERMSNDNDTYASTLHPDWADGDGPAAEFRSLFEYGAPRQYAITPGGSEVLDSPIGLTDVKRVDRYFVSYHGIPWHPGDSAGSELNMVVLAELLDGRWAALTAWNGYTGWGCQDGADVRVAALREVAISHGFSDEDRALLGLGMSR